jgi:Stage II sporulation protein E (SpoIIE)
MDDLDAVTGQVTADLLRHSHLMSPDAVAGVLAETARPLGVTQARIYLADLQQQYLEPLPSGDALAIDSTVAGRAYRSVTIQHQSAENAGDGYRVWIPLVDGTARLGVLKLVARDVGEDMLARYRTLGSLVALMIMAKSGYSDSFARTQRRRPMAMQAELVWTYLPPRTFATDRVLVAATLEPAYEAGGDAFDYALSGDHLHVSIFDALGHDLAAGLLASVGMASCRSTRRSGGTLADIADRADRAIAGQFGDSRFVTALLCDLDLATGQFSWIPCGHPPPLLIRGNKVVKELARPPRLPLGLAALEPLVQLGMPPARPALEPLAQLYTERLEPGDRVLLYTDGVTEGRAADRTSFGVQRLSDFVIRHSAAGLSAPETLRRLNQAILDFQQGRLYDDATIVLVEWLPDRPERNLTP